MILGDLITVPFLGSNFCLLWTRILPSYKNTQRSLSSLGDILMPGTRKESAITYELLG